MALAAGVVCFCARQAKKPTSSWFRAGNTAACGAWPLPLRAKLAFACEPGGFPQSAKFFAFSTFLIIAALQDEFCKNFQLFYRKRSSAKLKRPWASLLLGGIKAWSKKNKSFLHVCGGCFQLVTMIFSLNEEKNFAKFILRRLYFYFGWESYLRK